MAGYRDAARPPRRPPDVVHVARPRALLLGAVGLGGLLLTLALSSGTHRSGWARCERRDDQVQCRTSAWSGFSSASAELRTREAIRVVLGARLEEGEDSAIRVTTVELHADEGVAEVGAFVGQERARGLAGALEACLADPERPSCEQRADELDWLLALLTLAFGWLGPFLLLMWFSPRSRIEIDRDASEVRVLVGRLGPVREVWRGPASACRVRARFAVSGDDADVWALDLLPPDGAPITIARGGEPEMRARAADVERRVGAPPS